MRRASFFVLLCAALWLALVPGYAAAGSASLTPQEERGRQVYVTGRGSSGTPVVALFGKDLLEVPGESATCVSCHGYDGFGRSESGVIPSNITWRQLMKSYGHVHPDGSEHGPFTEQSLKSYMEDGVYPGGRSGDPSMPLYQMAAQDLDDLVAYLKKLDSHRDPGVSDTAIRIGTLVPSGGTAADMGDVMKRTITAYFNDINGQGGIYGRTLALVSEQAGSGAGIPALVRAAVPEQGVFALVNTYTPGVEADLWRMLEEQQVPLIAPFSFVPVDDQLLHRSRFYLYSGLREQAMALATYATRTVALKDPRIQVVYPRRDGMDDILPSVEAVYHAKGWRSVARVAYDPGAGIPAATLGTIRGDNPDLLLFLGGEADAGALIGALADAGCTTALFMPGVLAGKSVNSIPPSCRGRVWLSFPSLPGDRKEWGVREFQGMASRQRLAVTHQTAQLAAYASAKILVEGIRRAGRGLSRERLLEALEGMFEFDTGLTQPVTYNKNRRIGALGSHIVEVAPDRAGMPDFIVPRGWVPVHSP